MNGAPVAYDAIVMDHAVVGTGCIIAAGAVVLENFVCEPGYLYAGVPARKIKPVAETQQAAIRRTAGNYQRYAGWFARDIAADEPPKIDA